MDKIKMFKPELDHIKDERLRNNLEIIINNLPDYFFIVPASSTGKYHPSFSLGDGGLVRHTKVAVRIAKELLNNPSLNNFNQNEKDLIIFALTLHDGLKSGKVKSEYTLFEHPLLASQFVKENESEIDLTKDEIDLVCRCIETHMGPWTTNYKGEEVLSPPKDKYQRFVHMCDYIASRKFLDVKFKDNKIEDD
jgi:hypothetical protein